MISAEDIKMGNIGTEKRNTARNINKLNFDFEWDERVAKDFKQQGQYKGKKIYMFFG